MPRFEKYILSTVLALLLLVGFFMQCQHQFRVLTWDNFGYYLHLPAVFKYGDIREYKFTQQLWAQYHFSSSVYQISVSPNGTKTPTYTIGMALCYAPAYAAGEMAARVLGYPTDSLSLPYQVAVVLWAWLLNVAGLLLFYKLLRELLSAPYALLLLLLLLYGTNYFYYFTSEPATPHCVLFALYALLLFSTVRFYRQPSLLYGTTLCICISLLALARPSEIISIMLPLGYVWAQQKIVSKSFRWWLQHLPQLWLGMAIGVIFVLLQIWLWRHTTGHWLYNPYPMQLNLWHPHLLNGLFSFRKGWLLYTPAMLLLFMAFLLSQKYWLAYWKWPLLCFTTLQIWIVFSWPIWWYTSSFGMRALVQSYPVFVLGMAAVFSFVEKQNNRKWTISLVIAVGLFGALNLFQTYQYHARVLPKDGISKQYYCHTFLQTTFDRKQRIYLEQHFESPTIKEVVAQVDDTCYQLLLPHSFGKTLPLVASSALQNGFAESVLQCAQQTDDYGEYDFARVVLEIKRGDSTISWKEYNLQHLLEEQHRDSFFFYFPLCDLRPSDELKTYVWNNGPDTLHIYGQRLLVGK